VAFFRAAHLFFCAAAIFARDAALIFRLRFFATGLTDRRMSEIF
jgi:hypothetical protein